MADKFTVGFNDEASPGINKLEGNVADVGTAADKAEKELNQAAAAAKKLGDTGGKDTKKMSLQVTELNQGLELLKKGFELSARAVTSLAESGNPAAQSLVDSFGKLGSTMQALGDNKNVSDLMGGLASTITDQVIPAISAVPGWFEKSSQWLAKIGTQAAEFTGFFPEGTTESLAEDQVRLTEIAEAQRQVNEERRKFYEIEGKSAEMAERAAADRELANVARLESERQLRDLLDLEIEARKELSDAGELSGKKLEASDKRLEVIQRRLAELPQKRADAESKAANDIAQARIDAEQRWQDAVKASADATSEIIEERVSKVIEQANAATDRLMQAIAQAKGPGGGNLLDEARGGIGAEATRAQLVKQAQDAAREKFIAENRGKVDLEGRAWGDNETQRRQNQRQADRAIELAQRQAGSQVFRDFNAGKTSQEDIAGAQDALVQAAGQSAVARGQMDQSVLSALTASVNQHRQSVVRDQQLAAQVQQLQQAIQILNSTSGPGSIANGRRRSNL